MKNIRTEANAQHKKPPINKEDAQKNLRLQQAKDEEMVRGRFKYFELPGGAVDFVFKCYKTQDVERYSFIDGEIYTIPLGVARHLNKNCWYPEYGYAPTMPGEKTASMGGYNSMSGMAMRATKKVQRMGFESLEFMDVEDVAPLVSPIITIDSVIR